MHGRAIRALAGASYPRATLEAWATRLGPDSFVAPGPARHLIVAETETPTGPRIAGYGQLHVAEGTIEAIYVDPDFARRGVGGLLVRALEQEGRAHGLAGLVVDATLDSVPFYLALGYVAKGIDHHPLARGVSIDCAVMERRFRPAVPACE